MLIAFRVVLILLLFATGVPFALLSILSLDATWSAATERRLLREVDVLLRIQPERGETMTGNVPVRQVIDFAYLTMKLGTLTTCFLTRM